MMKKHEIILVIVGSFISVFFAVAIDDMVSSTAGRQPPFPGKPAAEKWILYDKQGNEMGFAEKR